MAKLEVSYEVHYRDEMGRFQAVLDEAATRSVKRTAGDLKREAVRNAPSGPPRKDYGRRPKLRKSIRILQLSSRSAAVGSDAGHAKANESGAPAHPIRTTWPHGEEHVINHPSMEGKHFLARAVDRIMPKFLRNMAEEYPG